MLAGQRGSLPDAASASDRRTPARGVAADARSLWEGSVSWCRISYRMSEAALEVANMLGSALQVTGDDRFAAEDRRLAPGAVGGDLPAAVITEAGARELPLDRAPVRVGGGGGKARLGAGAGLDDRRRSGRLGPRRASARGLQGARRPRVPGRGRSNLRA